MVDRRRQHDQHDAAKRDRRKGRTGNSGGVPKEAADHRHDHRATITDGEHRRGDAMHIVRRAQQRRQRQDQNENSRIGEALHGRRQHDPGTGPEHDAAGRDHAEQPASDVGPGLALQPARNGEQQKRCRNLPDVQPGQRRADPFALTIAAQVIRQESVGRKVGRIDGAQHDAEPPDQVTVPIGPPAAVGDGGRSIGRCRRQPQYQNGDEGDRHAPEYKAPLPTAADHWQHQRQHQRHRQDFTDQEAVGVDCGGKSDALGKPGAHHRRHGHLHDGNAGAHGDGHGVEPGHVGDGAAQCAADRGDGKPDHQRAAHAEPRDQQRAGHGGDGEQHRGQAGENADLGGVEMETIVDQRDDRRHSEDGEPQADAGQPQQQQRGEEASPRPWLAGALHGRDRHCGGGAKSVDLGAGGIT